MPTSLSVHGVTKVTVSPVRVRSGYSAVTIRLHKGDDELEDVEVTAFAHEDEPPEVEVRHRRTR